MGSIVDTTKIDMETKLSTSWIVVMFYMVFIDVLSYAISFTDVQGAGEEILKTAGTTPVSTLMLAAAVMLMAPIAMIFFSRVLTQKVNRWANIIVGIITIVFVVGGYAAYPHYYLLGAAEVLFMLYIIWSAWKWRK
jgi:O-antigen/teichoic acid export membrane protein